jgi:hypothetical protein
MTGDTFHTKPGCTGTWVDISTLAQRQSMCADCRAVVNFTLEDLEQMAAPNVIEQPPAEPKRFIPWRIVIWIITMIILAILYNTCSGGK